MINERAKYTQEWMRFAKEHYENARGLLSARRDNRIVPKPIWDRRYRLQEGLETIVYGFPKDTPYSNHVVKEYKRVILNPHLEQLVQNFLGEGYQTLFAWEDVGALKKNDYAVIKDILGSYVLSTVFFRDYASDGSGQITNYSLQRRINGPTLKEFISENYVSIKEDPDLRGQLLDIVWGAKKGFILFDVPLDLNGNNIMVLTDKTLRLIETGNPSLISAIIYNNYHPEMARLLHQEVTLNSTSGDRWESLLQPTERERIALDSKFGINSKEYSQKISAFYKF